MNFIKHCITVGISLLYLQTNAQQKIDKYHIDTEKKWLNIGDQVPDVIIERIRNSAKKTAKISDFKGKLLILDFWSKYCSVCIASFPKMEALQKEFGDRIQILLVSKNTEDELKLVLERSPNAKATMLPMPLGDTILNDIFPHSGEPYHVWIGPDGKIVGMTDGQSTNSTNIRLYLEKGDIKLPIRRDFLSTNILDAPIVDQLLNIPEPEKYLSGGVFILKKVPYIAFPRGFLSIPELIWANFLDDQSIMKNVVEVRDSANINKYFPPLNPDIHSNWGMENLYKIQISTLTPERRQALKIESEKDYIKRYLKEYVLSHFGISYTVENRKAKCLIMFKTGDVNHLKSKAQTELIENKKSSNGYVSTQMSGITVFRNASLANLFSKLRGKLNTEIGIKDRPPLINETGLDDSFKIDADIYLTSDLTKLNKELGKYGLGVKTEIRDVKCLVIKEL